MQIRLVDPEHLQFGPVTVALGNQRILSLICGLFAHDERASPQRRSPPRTSCH